MNLLRPKTKGAARRNLNLALIPCQKKLRGDAQRWENDEQFSLLKEGKITSIYIHRYSSKTERKEWVSL